MRTIFSHISRSTKALCTGANAVTRRKPALSIAEREAAACGGCWVCGWGWGAGLGLGLGRRAEDGNDLRVQFAWCAGVRQAEDGHDFTVADTRRAGALLVVLRTR